MGSQPTKRLRKTAEKGGEKWWKTPAKTRLQLNSYFPQAVEAVQNVRLSASRSQHSPSLYKPESLSA
mgnify:CR=1 FL=1